MLNRAVKQFQPPPKRTGTTSALFIGTPPDTQATQTTIEDGLKQGRQASQSIGGYTNLMNSNASMTSYSGQTKSGYQSVQTKTTKSNPLKRKSADREGLVATLNAGGFEDMPNSKNLLQYDHVVVPSRSLSPEDSYVMVSKASTVPANVVFEASNTSFKCTSIPSHPTSQQTVQEHMQQAQFEFNPDDFDDDSELDLDVEYPQPLPPMSASRKPLHHVSPNPSQNTLSNLPSKVVTPKMTLYPSSSMTWSSSPAAHKGPPPGVLRTRQAEEYELPVPPISSEASVDANPRPAKRRTVPWLQREAEQTRLREEARAREEEAEITSSSVSMICFKCRKPGHTQADCTSAPAYTPMAKEKSLPWNTTASAVKAQQKQKKLAKDNLISMEAMRGAVHDANTTAHGQQAPIFLSEEQKSVLDLVTAKKKSVFFTGSAGTGKSVLMRAIIAELRRMHVREPDRVAVTASTGLAACNIGGVTLHSFGGIGLGKEEVPELVKKINRNQKAKQRWLRTKILIIDEISMVDGALFDKLERIACTIRKNGRPFGGIQLVITGDFFQLPPVPDFGSRQIKFAFDAATWSTSINHTIGLTEVFRQRDPGIVSRKP